MPCGELTRAQMLCRLCDLTIKDEFSYPLAADEALELCGLRNLLPLILPERKLRHPWEDHLARETPRASELPRRAPPPARSVTQVFRAALGCEGCPSTQCPLATLHVARPAASDWSAWVN